MSYPRLALFLVLLLARLSLGLSPDFIECQVQKPAGQSALTGCPEGTILVAQDGSGDFTTVQDAILSLDDDDDDQSEVVILIAEGEYEGAVNVTRSGPLTLLVRMEQIHTAQSSDPV